ASFSSARTSSRSEFLVKKMESKLHLGPECTLEVCPHVDYMPPTPATCLPEGETGSEEEAEKGEKASSSSSMPGSMHRMQCGNCALVWQGFGQTCPRCHLCPGMEMKQKKDPVDHLHFEPRGAVVVGQSLPPIPPPVRSAPEFHEAQLPPAPSWESEPKFLQLETFGEEDHLEMDEEETIQDTKSRMAGPLPTLVEQTQVPLASLGSILHGTGTCKPCAWFWKPQGCRNGAECNHCHLCPAGESKNRRQAKMAAWRAEARHEEPQVSWRPPPGLEQDEPEPVVPVVLGSVGSAKHSTGECTLCPEAFTPEGCPKGPRCEKCHLCAAEFRAVYDEQKNTPAPSRACILCGKNQCSCPRIHMGVAAERLNLDDTVVPLELPSLGSVRHAKGNCSPCAWVWKPQGCHNGASCGRCHLCPPGEVKLRKKAKAREARHGSRKDFFCSSY
ncbi:unnamed protein product, partial [Durusdinium trenchii]